ncbi:MAG: hypothetical protein JWQ20_4119 [Conexibacter sp.]|nr:hypothetical protein [Conexibacter sp.]
MTLVVVGLAGSVIASAVFSAFSATTDNTGNVISAGTVAISDNDAAAEMYNVTDQTPGTITSKCIEVTYTGSLASAVKLYTPSTLDPTANYINLKITPGTQTTPTFPSCTGFTADAGGAIYNGDMAAFATAHSDWSSGLALDSGASTTWAQGDIVVYKIEVNVIDDPLAQGATSGAHDFTWEAQNT